MHRAADKYNVTHTPYLNSSVVLGSLPTMDANNDIEKQEAAIATPSAGASPTESISGLAKANCKFSWKDVSYVVDTPKGKKHILQNVNGCVEKGTPDFFGQIS